MQIIFYAYHQKKTYESSIIRKNLGYSGFTGANYPIRIVVGITRNRYLVRTGMGSYGYSVNSYCSKNQDMESFPKKLKTGWWKLIDPAMYHPDFIESDDVLQVFVLRSPSPAILFVT